MTTATTVQVKLKLRGDTAANWTSVNPVLLANELGRETDTGKIKIGNGSTAWTSLAYQPFGALITNADISATAEIAVSKLADGAPRQLLQTDAAGTGVEWASNIDIPGTLDVTGAGTFDGNVTIQGDLTVNGTTTTIDTTNLAVEDKNIEIGKVTTPTDVTADGGGITLKGATDKTINWVDATDAWTFSEHVDLASAKEYRIAGVKVLDATSLGSAVVSSSLTSVGTIGTGVWQGTAIDKTYLDSTLVSTGDTGTVTSTMIADGTIVDGDINASAAIVDTKLATIATAGKVSNSATTATSSNTVSTIVARDGSGNFSAGTITADLAGNASTVTTNANLTGDVTSVGNATSIAAGVIVDGDVNASAAIAGTKISPDFGSQTVATTGVFSHALGAAATPSITFTGDLNTGIYSPGADQVAVATNGTGRLFINSTGDAGVGVSSIASGGANTRNVQIHNTNSDGTYLKLTNGATGATAGDGMDIIVDGSGNGYIYNRENAAVIFGAGNLERLRITSTGALNFVGAGTAGSTQAVSFNGSAPVNSLVIDSSGRVGIGTSAPAEKLHIEGAGTQTIRLRNSTTGSAASPQSTFIQFYGHLGAGGVEPRVSIEAQDRRSTVSGGFLNIATANSSNVLTNALHIDNAQRVGIGTTSPSSLLHLADAGDITVGTTTGTKIGTATTQKLGFYNATPVVQPAAVADATDAATVITQLNDLLAKLRTLGIIAT